MARIRSIKPEFFSSERIAALSDPAKITFIGLWCEADDYGVAHANPRVLKGHIWPLADHITAADIAEHLDELTAGDPLIERYTADGKDYALIRGFEEHQKVPKPSQKRNPRPPSSSPPVALPESSSSPPSTTRPVENPLPEPYAEEVEGEKEVEREVEQSSSSSGPVHQEISTGPDDDDQTAPTVDLSTPHDRARAAANVLGKRDQRTPAAAGVAVQTPSRHLRGCVDSRWDLWGADLVRFATEFPTLTASELADLVDPDPAQAAQPGGRASPTPAARPRIVTVDGQPRFSHTLTCPTCQGRTGHDDGTCGTPDPAP